MTTGTAPQCDVYTTPGAFTYNVPAGRSLVFVTMAGAGCGGNRGGAGPSNTGGGGGGGGELCVRVPYVVTPGGTVSAVVGTGGAGGTAPEEFGAAGSDSVFGNLRCQGAPQSTTVTHTYGSGDYGGGKYGPAIGVANSAGLLGRIDGVAYWGGSSGGPDTAGGNVLRVGGPAGGHYGVPVNASSDRGGGGGAATIFAAGATGADPATNGATGTYGGGGAGGGGAGAGNGGLGGHGYILVEYC